MLDCRAYPSIVFVTLKCDFDHLQQSRLYHIIRSICNAKLWLNLLVEEILLTRRKERTAPRGEDFHL